MKYFISFLKCFKPNKQKTLTVSIYRERSFLQDMG